jgi:hypothetical protein
MLGFELEVMSKKVDKFGWDQERGTDVQDRVIRDWMDALQGFPLDDVKAACRTWIMKNPRKMPNEGDILAILKPKPLTYAQRILAGTAR